MGVTISHVEGKLLTGACMAPLVVNTSDALQGKP